MSSRKHASLVLCSVLSLMVLNTCVHIEAWNALAGGELPMEEPGKMRWDMNETERGWRYVHLSERHWDTPLEERRPLTRVEREQFQKDAEQAQRHNRLRWWTQGWGLAQYALAPIALIWSGILLLPRAGTRSRLLPGCLLLTNALSVISMLYRGYFHD